MKLILVDIVIINGNILYVYRESVSVEGGEKGDLYGTKQLFTKKEKQNIILQRMSDGQDGDKKFVIEDRVGINATVINNNHNGVILEVGLGAAVELGVAVKEGYAEIESKEVKVVVLPYLRAVKVDTSPYSKYIDWSGVPVDPVNEPVEGEIESLFNPTNTEIQKNLQSLCAAEPFNENDLLRILNGKGSGGEGGGRVFSGGGATMMLHQSNTEKEEEVKQARLEYLQELKNNLYAEEEGLELENAIKELTQRGGGKYPKKSKSKSKKSKKSKSKKSKSKKSKSKKSKKSKSKK
jgi:hypothetical protein